MGLGEVIGNAVDAYNGTSSGTTLEDFLSKFSPASGTAVNTIDTLHTFEVQIKFYPASDSVELTGMAGALDSLKKAGAQALNNLANNITGGLLGAFMNSKKDGIMTKHNSYSDAGKKTFMKYLAEASLLLNSDNALNLSFGQTSTDPVELNLGFYVQSITIPQLKIEMTQSDTLVGKFPVNGLYVQPDNNTMTMSILNTKLPLHEIIFYPWMREITLPYWSYNLQPYTTATIIVDMSKHADLKYVFYGCRPNQIQTFEPTQEPDTTLTRDVTITFDYMLVKSGYKTTETVMDKLLGSAAGLAGAAGNMLNL